MRQLRKCFFKSALGLGVGALLLAGSSAQVRCQERQPLMLVQEKAPEKEKKAMEQLLGETQKQQKSMQPKQQKAMPRELMKPGSPGKPTTVQDAPARAGTRKFGAQPIRSKEPSQED